MNKQLARRLEKHKEACLFAVHNWKCGEAAETLEQVNQWNEAAEQWMVQSGMWAMHILFEAKPEHRNTLINLLKRRHSRAVGTESFGKWVAA